MTSLDCLFYGMAFFFTALGAFIGLDISVAVVEGIHKTIRYWKQ